MPKSSAFYSESDFSIDNKFTEITLMHASENGYSEVYKAIRHGKWHILKRLTDEEKDNPRYQSLLRKEFDISYPLSHPGIVHTVGMEDVEGLGFCIIQEYIDGISWLEFTKGKKVKREEYRRIISQLCLAIDYIHQRQIIHRDLTPKNILITRDGHQPRIIDFGLADNDVFVYLKEPAGTTGYASPEQQKPGILDNRSDIYSLGVLIEGICAPLDFRLKRIAKKCLANNPEKRYVSAKDIYQKLQPSKWWRWGLLLMFAAICLICVFWQRNNIGQESTIARLQQQSKELEQEVVQQRREIASQQAHITNMKKDMSKMNSTIDSTKAQNTNITERIVKEDQQAKDLANAKKELRSIADKTYNEIWNKHTELADNPAKRKVKVNAEVYLVKWQPIVNNLIKKYNLDTYKNINAQNLLMDEWFNALYAKTNP